MRQLSVLRVNKTRLRISTGIQNLNLKPTKGNSLIIMLTALGHIYREPVHIIREYFKNQTNFCFH